MEIQQQTNKHYETFLLSKTSRQAVGSTHPAVNWVLGDLSPGLKRPGRQSDHWSQSSVEVKNEEACASPYTYVCMGIHRDTAVFTSLFRLLQYQP
jgi:hypothetical protein